MIKILTYNVNGIRAAWRKGLGQWLEDADADIICLQELKATENDLPAELMKQDKWKGYFHPAEKKGYSGVGILTKIEPQHVEIGCGISDYDCEGRIIRADYEKFSLISVYLPSGSSGDHRQEVKDRFLIDFYAYISKLRKEIPNLIVSGDYNICHREIDIHNPVSNKNSSGFLPHERQWMSEFIDSGFIDAFRHFNPEPHHYSWWSYRANARKNNKGWRIDYHMVAEPLKSSLAGARLHPDAVHSDHCPVELQIKI